MGNGMVKVDGTASGIGPTVDPRAMNWHMFARGLNSYRMARKSGVGYSTIRRLLHATEPEVRVHMDTAERLMETFERIPVKHPETLIGPDPGPPVRL